MLAELSNYSVLSQIFLGRWTEVYNVCKGNYDIISRVMNFLVMLFDE